MSLSLAGTDRAIPLIAIQVLLGVSCHPDAPTPRADRSETSLVEITSYGWSSPADATHVLSSLEMQYSGAELGNVVDIAEDGNGYVYVLDAAFQKVVVFEPDGRYDRLILGGSGQGPGEFTRPRSISVDSDGFVWVYDQVASRLTQFTSQGDAHRTVAVPVRLLTIRSHDGLIYGVRTVDGHQAALVVLDSTGRVVSELIRPSAQDLRVGGGSASFAAGFDSERGNLLVAHPSIGVWSAVASNGVEVFGEPLFVNADPVVAPVSEHSPRLQHHLMHHIWGIGSASEDRIAIFFANGSMNPEAHAGEIYQLGLFRRDGQHLETIHVAADRGTFYMSSINNDILIVRELPHPRVVRLRLSTGNS